MTLPKDRNDREYKKFEETSEGNVAVRVIGATGSTSVSVESSATNIAGSMGGYSNVKGDFTATPTTSSNTIIITGLPFTLTKEAIILIEKIDSSGNKTILDANPVTVSSGVITLADESNFSSGDSVNVVLAGPDRSYDSDLDVNKIVDQNPLWSRYTDSETLVTAQDLTGSYADFGSEIDMRGYTHLRVGIVLDVNDSTNITLKLLGLESIGGSDEFEIEGGTTQAISHAADNKFSYTFDVKGSPVIQLQAIAGTVGATAGDLTITINKVWKGGN